MSSKEINFIENIKKLPGIDEYIRLFLYFTKNNSTKDMSFIKYQNNETLEDKENIIKFFSILFPNYKFYFSYEKTAFFYKPKENKK